VQPPIVKTKFGTLKIESEFYKKGRGHSAVTSYLNFETPSIKFERVKPHISNFPRQNKHGQYYTMDDDLCHYGCVILCPYTVY